jgi:hypothetical protein
VHLSIHAAAPPENEEVRAVPAAPDSTRSHPNQAAILAHHLAAAKGRAGAIAPDTPKAVVTALAEAARAGILASAARDDRGRRTVILTHGAWTREVPPEGVAAALEELRAIREEVAA